MKGNIFVLAKTTGKMKIRLISFLAVTSLIIASWLPGCKKSSGSSSLLVLDIHASIGADSVVYGATYSNPRGRHISFGRIQYYISGIQMNSSGGALAVNAYVLD